MQQDTPSVALALFTALALLAGCGEGERGIGDSATGSLEPISTDSAGVNFLSHSGDAFERAPQLELDSASVAVITGSAEDIEADISTITPYLFMPDGRLVGSDRQRQVMVVFSADGATRQEFGGKGAGPGEFGYIGNVVLAGGDTLLLNDYRNARVSELDLATGNIRDVPIATAVGEGGTTLAGRVGEQWLMWSTNFAPPSDDGTSSPPGVKLTVFSPSRGEARRVFTSGVEEKPPEVMVGPGGAMAVRAISIQPLTAFPTATEWRSHYLITSSSAWRLEIRDTAGALKRVITIERPRVPISPAVWNHYVDQSLQELMGPSIGGTASATMVMGRSGAAPAEPDRDEMRAQFAGQPHPDSLPGYQRVQVSPNGTLWILDYPVPGDSTWAATAMSPDGEIIGRLKSLHGNAPLVFGDDRVVFRTEDDDGIATLTVTRIR
jgi:hypothetical protein